ncbi:PEBP-like protein [Gymnopus androsaceus JB14]|uniref:PEBP-like protein n=1 Tax=Gymnopus androsaceus JB14 TaxID=1447944 RepID=A0A6A4HYP9_9AGAR|nr:PEBP-like protein [Gymnopus androsaceus JB14]
MRFPSLAYFLPLHAFFTTINAQDTSLAAVKAAFDAADLPEDIFLTFDPSVLLEVTFPETSGKDIILHAGIHVPQNDTAGPPSFAVIGHAGKGPFVVAAIDPDAPTPQDPTDAEIRHFLGANFFASVDEPVQHLTNVTPAISEFIQPTPPAGSPAHRYTFLLFNQPPGFNSQTLVNSSTSVENFNLSSFALATGLGHPIGGTFMLVAPEPTT